MPPDEGGNYPDTGRLELQEHHREIFNPRCFCGMSFAEIAVVLQIGTEATARKALRRAVERLRDRRGLDPDP